MSKLTLNQIIDRVRDLPTLPQIVVSLMSAIDDPRSNANQINQIMVNDPALASRVLKLVNSSFYSLPRKISSIRDAVVEIAHERDAERRRDVETGESG